MNATMITNASAALVEPRGLTIDALERNVPAIFATAPDSRVSEGYSFIPTRPLLEAIVADGWTITAAQNQMAGRGKSARVKDTGAHLIRFRRADIDITRDDLKDGYPEILLINSHDRTKRYMLAAGIFRLVCSNGLIIGSHLFQPTRLTHYNVRQTQTELIIGAQAIAAKTTLIMTQMQMMRERELTEGEQINFAAKAIELRYRGYATPLKPEALLNARRPEDEGRSLWRTLNRVQEHLMVGGLSTGRSHTRPMASLFEGVGVNQGLWRIAEEFLVPTLELPLVSNN